MTDFLTSIESEKDIIHFIVTGWFKPKVIPTLRKELFSDGNCQKSYQCIKELYDDDIEINMMTFREHCLKKKYLKAADIGKIIKSRGTPTNVNVEQMVLFLEEKRLMREMKNVSEDIVHKIDSATDVFDLISITEDNLDKLKRSIPMSNASTIQSMVKEHQKLMHTPVPTGITGLRTGFDKLDAVTLGLNVDNIILGGATSMGKTSFALAVAKNVSELNDVPVLFVSLEMDETKVMNRLVAIETEVPLLDIRRRNLSAADLHRVDIAHNKLFKSKLSFDCSGSINLQELQALITKIEPKLVIIDYIQLVSWHQQEKNRATEVSKISRSMKILQQKSGIPFIQLSQFSRSLDKEADKKPQLHHLKESGDIENDADMVWFLYRPEYYGIMEYANGNPTKGICELEIAKYRDGERKQVIALRFKENIAKFSNRVGSYEQI